MNYTVVFFTHSGAIKFDKKMNMLNIICSLQPVPRKLSSSCGICAKIIFDGDIKALIENEIESIHMNISKNQYKEIYNNH